MVCYCTDLQAGTGKTLLACEIISKMIKARPPKIVAAAPDLLDKWVGGTEIMNGTRIIYRRRARIDS